MKKKNKKNKNKECHYCKKDIIGVEPVMIYYDGVIEFFDVKFPTEFHPSLHPWCDKISDFRHYSKEDREYEIKKAKELHKEWKIEREKRRWFREEGRL